MATNENRLFDEAERTDATPAAYTEDSFSFLNRAAGPYWDRIRSELERWYADFPDTTGDLRKRFRNRRPKQHYGAWWELYLHRVFRRLGYEATPNTDLPEGSSRPDLLLQRGSDSFYVEAVAVSSGITPIRPPSAMEPEILDIINSLDASNYFLSVRFGQTGAQMPRRGQIIGPIREWMATYDPDVVLTMSASELPTKQITVGGWVLELRLMPRSPEYRGRSDNRLIGMHGAIGGFMNNRQQIRRALETKRKQHKAQDAPMVIAVLALNGAVENEDVIGALFGSQAIRVDIATGTTTVTRNPDGLWVGKSGISAKKVSAVLTGTAVLPNTCATAPLRLWHHFAPDHELSVDLPFASVRVEEDGLVFTDATEEPYDILGLFPEWPGPDPPFPS